MDYTMLLRGKRALITSGAHGMGFAIARLFARQGCACAICGQRDSGEESAEALRLYAPESFFFKADMSNKEEVEAFCDETLKRFGTVDIIVNNVGINKFEKLLEVTDENHDYVQRVNINSVLTIVRKLVPSMIQQGKGGSLIHISSVNAVASFPGMSSYVVSKGGCNALSRVIATELGEFNIRSNVICPGSVFTQYWEARWKKYTTEEEKVANVMEGQKSHPALSPGHAEDIANAALFLASDMSAFVTGATLMLDGGAAQQAHMAESFILPNDYNETIQEYTDSFMIHDELLAMMREAAGKKA